MIVFASMDQPDITHLELFETKSIPSGTLENTQSLLTNDPMNSLNVRNAGIIFFGATVALQLLKMVSHGRRKMKSL
jgi:hypothetical protein